MKNLQLTGVGFVTIPHATTKLSIVNTVQKISQIFSYSVAEIVWKKQVRKEKLKLDLTFSAWQLHASIKCMGQNFYT